MRAFFLVIAAIPLAAACAFLPQVKGCAMSHAPKIGKVVDADTGKGIPNATVLAGATFRAGPLVHGSSNERLYHIVSHTDNDGNFSLPSTWRNSKIGIPGTDPTTTWTVTVLLPGYAVAGDEKGWSFDQRGDANFEPRSVEFSPAAEWRLFVVELEPIRMVKRSLSLKEAAIYYSKVASVGLSVRGSRNPVDVSIRRLGLNALLPSLCALPTEARIDNSTANALRFFAIDYQATEQQLQQLEPASYQLAALEPVSYAASSLCQALHAGDHI